MGRYEIGKKLCWLGMTQIGRPEFDPLGNKNIEFYGTSSGQTG